MHTEIIDDSYRMSVANCSIYRRLQNKSEAGRQEREKAKLRRSSHGVLRRVGGLSKDPGRRRERIGSGSAVKTLEQLGNMFVRNARPVVLDSEVDAVSLLKNRHKNLPGRRDEFKRVGEQVT